MIWLVLLAMRSPGPAGAQLPWLAPPEPAVRPQLPRRGDLDIDNNRVDDRLDGRIAGLRRSLQTETVPGRRMQLAQDLAAPLHLELVFDSQISQKQIDDFVALGGSIDHVYRAVSYGWSGSLPGSALDALPASMGNSLLVVAEQTQAELHLDEATRTGRVRPVWARGFAGASNGVSGTDNITIGIVDSGVDDSHADLSGRNEFWKDYTTDAEATPRDVGQHGSHVAGIALGTGAAFGAGPGTFKYTDSGDLTGIAANSAFISRIHIAPPSLSVTSNAQFNSCGVCDLKANLCSNCGTKACSSNTDCTASATLAYGSGSNGALIGFQTFNSVTGASALNLVTSPFSAYAFQHYSSVLIQNATKTITTYAVSNSVAGYAAVGDGFNAMRGAAPGARWAGAKVFTNAGAGTSTTIGAAVDDMVAQRTAHNIKVVNMSLGIIGAPGLDLTLRSKVNTMVNNGIVAVCSAGNDGPGSSAASAVDDPGRAALALTVGATNDINALTKYSSAGFATVGPDEDYKPDLLAPGGSDYYSLILSVDSNDGDTGKPGFADKVPNDYLNMKGTSMSAPFAAGSAALVIDALQKSGVIWAFSSSAQPLLVKMLLSASATETNANREGATGSNPTLGRAAAPKDLFEGYGILNADAAVEAVLQIYNGGGLSGATECQVPAAECATWSFDRRAWGRRVAISSGAAVTLNLTVPTTADFDLYLYSGTPDAKGNPVILASSANAGTGVGESLTFTPSPNGSGYLFVKKVSGYGSWSLDSATATTRCGDGIKAATEACDDGNLVDGDCCSANCTLEVDGSTCSDGLFCTASDTCSSGVCRGTGNPCTTGPECRNTCSEASGSCVSPADSACAADPLACTTDQCDGAGSCVHNAGNAGTVCRAAAGICDVAETCSGSSTACPADTLTATSVVCRATFGVCDVAEFCTGISATCPSDLFAQSNVVCRASAGVCDVAENCSGASASCPSNFFQSPTTICRGAAGVCDSIETCSGVAANCPVDAFVTATAVCRGAAGVCDAAEMCSGASASCPADTFAMPTTVCRVSAGVCDMAEICSGTAASCPADAFGLSSKVCRASAGTCDAAEACTGTAAMCPADSFLSSLTVCRTAAGVCDAGENCTGVSASCPADGFVPSTTVCRAASGACDTAENCSGASVTCPADSFATSTTVCRTSAGVCDMAESCSGTSPICPLDGMAASGLVCRVSAGECDLPESCSGTAKDCPANALATQGTGCSTDENLCTTDLCNGSSAGCEHTANTVSCDDGVFCNGSDICSGGSCSMHAGTPCPGPDGDGNCAESCDEASSSCTAPDANRTSCDDGLFCDGADECSNGACSQHAGTPCAEADGDSNCSETCDESGKSCAASDADGSFCDDGDSCTVDDACLGGACAGDPSTVPGCIATTTTTLPESICGDANGDGRITSVDALRTLRAAVSDAECPLTVCDFNGDGRVAASDALGILRFAVGQSTAGKCPDVLLQGADELPVSSSVSTTLDATTTTTPDWR